MPDEAPADLREIVEEQRARWAVPGVAVGVLAGGEARCWAFGTADLETGQAVTPGTVFMVGSITKVFVATAVMMLVDGWKAELDAPVKRYLPEFALLDPEAAERLTVRHLLTHTGGFWGDDFTGHGRGDDAQEKTVASLAMRQQLTSPGELWHYNNAAFPVLGRLIERAVPGRFEEHLRHYIFGPLELERTMWRAGEAITYPRAVPYMTDPNLKNEPARQYELPGGMNAAGGIISTVGDLLRFAGFHMSDGMADGHRVLTRASIDAMQTPQVPAANMATHWGLGWGIRGVDGERMVSHGGAWTGFRASLAVVPAKGFAVAVLTNGSNGAALYRHVNRWALREYAGLEDRDPEPIALPVRDLERFVGTFTTPTAEAAVSIEGEGLRIEGKTQGLDGKWTALPVSHAVPVGEREFLITDSVFEGSTFDYILNADGSVRFRRFGGRLQIPGGPQ
jgi:CubicO group peptidase (beta-lactamase class C family)